MVHRQISQRDPKRYAEDSHRTAQTKGVMTMMKKMLLTLTAAGMLAVPAGVALAQDDGAEPTAPVATCEDQVRRQDRDRVNEQDPVAEQSQDRAQHQFRIRDGDRDCDATGGQDHERTRTRVEDGTGGQAQNRHGEMGRADAPGNDS
jgi:hypothetical protein